MADHALGAETGCMSTSAPLDVSSPEEEAVFEDDLNPFELAPGRRHDVKPRGMVCTHCQGNTVLVGGEEIYPHRPDLFDRYFWLCRLCEAWVGCHRAQKQVNAKGKEVWSNGAMPLGSVANKELRALRHRVHALFDPIWKSGAKTRVEAYDWLSGVLGVASGRAHVAWMNVEQCKVAIAALRPDALTLDELSQVDEPSDAALVADPVSIDMAAERKLAERFALQVGNLRSLATKLEGAGLQYQVRNNGHHVIVHAATGAFDVWPSTQKWKSRATGETNQGLGGLLARARGA